MSQPTIRKQRIRRSSVKVRLIVFGTLAVLLILFSVFSEQLTPYDPYLQDLSNAKARPRQNICWAPTAMGAICSRALLWEAERAFSPRFCW